MGREHAVLFLRGETPIERRELNCLAQAIGEGIAGIADLPFAGEEDEDVAVGVTQEFGDGIADGIHLVDVVVGPVADLDREGAPRYLDHRGVAKVRAEALGVQGRGGDDDAQVWAPGQQPGEIAQQEVDIERALVSLVDDDRVVCLEQSITADGREEHAIGHDRDRGIRTRPVGEADAIPHPFAQGRLEFLGKPLGHRARGNASRLGVGDTGCAVGLPAA